MKLNKGQSLIEVVVSIGVMSILLVALLASISISMRNSRIAKNKAQATSLAQEGIELMRAYRDSDWVVFFNHDGSEYDLPYSWTIEDDLINLCPITYSIQNIFRRCVDFNSEGNSDRIKVSVQIKWMEGSNEKQVNQITYLSKWER